MVQARKDAASRDAPPPPAALRPVLRFTRLPTRALQTVEQVLDQDGIFRGRVAEGAEEQELGRASWLFLQRPEGWREELELLAAVASEEQADTEASRREQSAERRLEQSDATVDRLRSELAEATTAMGAAESALELERTARRRFDAERAELVERVTTLDDERSRAVRELKKVEAAAVERLDQVRAEQERSAALADQVEQLRTELAASRATAGAEPGRGIVDLSEGAADDGRRGRSEPASESAWTGLDPQQVANAVERASDAAEQLGVALSDAVRALRSAGADDVAVARPVAGEQPGPAPSGSARPPRRSPVRLRGGVLEDSAEGLHQLLGVLGMVALVDGYNVTMEGWPSLDAAAQRSSLIAAVGGLQVARSGLDPCGVRRGRGRVAPGRGRPAAGAGALLACRDRGR